MEGCNTREKAESLKGTELWICRTALPHIDSADEFYIADMIGLDVLNADHEKTGSITAVQNYGAGDLLEIKPHNGAPYFVLFHDDYVQDININAGYVILVSSHT